MQVNFTGPVGLTFVGAGTLATATSLELTLAGTATSGLPAPWSTTPYLALLRAALVPYAQPIADDQLRGATVLELGRMTPVYNVVNALDAGIYVESSTAGRRRVADVDTYMQRYFPYVPMALHELALLGARDPVTELLLRYLSSDSPVARVSGLSTMLTLGAILQLHPGV